MKKRKNRWSPYPMIAYTVTMPNGDVGGLGARTVFQDRPGLWNIFWLHSVMVDQLLTWSGPPEQAPGMTAVLNVCEESAEILVGARTLESMAEDLSAFEFVKQLRYLPDIPIKIFWDESTNDSWLAVVSDRLGVTNILEARYKPDNVVRGLFGC